MDTTQAVLLANTLSFVVYAIIAFWYVVPWMQKQERAIALVPLLWVHAFRHVALQVFSAQKAGLVVPDHLRNAIAFGDVAGTILALGALIALRLRSRLAIPITWVFVVATAADLVNAMVGGMREKMLGAAYGVTWLILAFYVPALWTTLALIVWQLVSRRPQVPAGR
ncbi:MAG TPA: hypothetical protein VER58_10850 [Thermoanaerobaculia bacterium]|nr:hypothetical protein [Thermoanaerobaculia bacterium]